MRFISARRFRSFGLILVVSIAAPGMLARADYTLTTLATFNASSGGGIRPFGPLLPDASGNLFGVTIHGGPNDAGSVFELAVGTHTPTTLAMFNLTNGRFPVSGLISDSSGNLYGTTEFGGTAGNGNIFEVAAGSHALTTIATLGYTNGATLLGGVIMDSKGNFFGAAEQGGSSGVGTIFQVAAGTHALSTLATFTGAKGSDPGSGLLADSNGNLYGTAWSGGANNMGTVFELPAGSHTLTTLATFNGANGANPYASLIFDASGNLYGTTYYGGDNNDGTVFEIAAGTHTFTTLAMLDGTHGANPEATLLRDTDGNLFGTTYEGGTLNEGTVFEIPAATQTLTTLASFTYTNGSFPLGGLIEDASGNLYGTTQYGGSTGNSGTVFELSPTPEPGSLVLLGLGAIGAIMRRR